MPEVDVSVGVADDLLAPDHIETEVRPRERSTTETQYEGPDGLLVRVGPLWSEPNMRQQPQERH